MTRRDESGAAATMAPEADEAVDPETGEVLGTAGDRLPRRVRTANTGGEQLRSFVERWERLAEEKAALAEDLKQLKAEAKGAGYDVKIIAAVIKIRAMGPADWQEWETLVELYLDQMGMRAEPPLFRAAGLAGHDPLAKAAYLDVLSQLVAGSGEGSLVVEQGGRRIRLERLPDGSVQQTEIVDPPPGAGGHAAGPGGGGAAAGGGARRTAPPPPPEGSIEDAAEMGRQAARDNVPVTKNPFLYGDARRAAWDRAWCEESGSDGMGPGG